MDQWNKYEYVCPYCDSLVTYVTKDSREEIINPCPICNEHLTLMSVEDATILPTNEQKEDKMETVTPAQTMTLDWVENDVTTTETYTESDIRAMVWRNKALTTKQNEWYTKESQLRSILVDNMPNADDDAKEVYVAIAEAFDIPLTVEREVTIYVRVDATVEVDMAQNDFDLVEEFVKDNLSIDSFGSEMNVSNWEITEVEDGAY
jgi:hypothetical protein